VFQVADGNLGDIDNVFLDNIKITGADADCNPINWVGVQHFKINNVTVLGGGVTADQFALSGCQDGVVSNCHSEGGGNHGFAADYNSEPNAYPQRILFIGNTAMDNAANGFYLSGIDSNDNKFVGNFSSDNLNGIVIGSGVKNALLKNTCRDNTAYGIHICQDANDTIIMGNILSGNETNLVYDPNSTKRKDIDHNIEN
jgi:nitrous oxidase accessory protein NosD